MGFLIDSSVLIAAERGKLPLDEVSRRAGTDTVAISAVTASELLHGVHRADTPRRRQRRQRFVEDLLSVLPVLPFDLEVARIHAALWADLAGRGAAVGAHDLLIAATAVAYGLTIATRDKRHFDRFEDLSAEVW